MATKLSDLTLEQYLLKELPAPEMDRVRRLIRDDVVLQQRLAKLEQSNQDILRDYPAESMSAGILRRQAAEIHPLPAPEKKKWFTRPLLLPSLSLAAATLLMLIAFPSLQTNLFQGGELTRIKGMDAHLFIYRKQANKIELLKNGSQARQGDLLQIAYISTKRAYGMILSIDGRKHVTLHTPANGAMSSKLTLNKKTLLTASYELDNAPKFERFLFITADEPLDIPFVLRAAQTFADSHADETVAQDPLPLPETLRQTSVLIRKGDLL